jgi:hypothetical protein
MSFLSPLSFSNEVINAKLERNFFNRNQVTRMKQHAVPENIMDVEFKLFGSLTAKQFGYIIAGGGVGLFFFYLFKSLGSSFLGIIFAFLSVVLGLSLALIRINEQPFEIWLGNFLAAMFSSQKRVWRKSRNVPDSLKKKDEVVATKEEARGLPSQLLVKPKQKPRQITGTVAKPKTDTITVPEHPFKDMKKEEKKVEKEEVQPSSEQKVDQVVAGEDKQTDGIYIPGSAQGFVSTTSNQQSRPLGAIASSPSATKTIAPSPSVVQTNTGAPTFTPSTSNMPTSGQAQSDTGVQAKPSPQATVPEPKAPQQGTGQLQNDDLQKPDEDQSFQKSVDNVILPDSSIPKGGIEELEKPLKEKEVSSSRMKHTNMAAQLGDVLPSREEVIGKAVVDKLEVTSDATQPKGGDIVHEENEKLRQKLASFSEDKSRLESELGQEKRGREELEARNKEIMAQIEQLRSEVNALKTTKPKQQEGPQLSQSQIPKVPVKKEVQKDTNLLSPKVYDGPSLSKKPNVVSGIVKTKDGNLLPGVVVIVKNDKGRPVRAMKTNSLGQFVTTTALENGTYEVELSKASFSFGSYEISLSGELVPTYEFLAQ